MSDADFGQMEVIESTLNLHPKFETLEDKAGETQSSSIPKLPPIAVS